ncbi:MAG: HU family DNA-binding protein [Deferribacteraceae bacterium]|jgi:DNA-binding protein HU-alpha|nr:HU family DNA-binding protein [Deferribacteraceae bacterium]
MNKQELVDAIALETKLTKKLSQAALESIITIIIDSVKKGDPVTLVGFGTFKVSERKARKGRNPQTGKEIKIPATKAPKFVVGKAFKEAVK